MSLSLPQKSAPSIQGHSKSGSFAYGKISDELMDNNEWKNIDKICVIARFRPNNKKEVRWSKQNNIRNTPPQFLSSQQVLLEPSPLSSGSRLSIDFDALSSRSSKSTSRQFSSTLDCILSPSCTQRQVFYKTGIPMIMSCLEGYNCTLFAYGQSGSGKTYTMMGPTNQNVRCGADDFGLVPRCIIYLFQKLDESLVQNGGNLQDYEIKMELLQIYKDNLMDLLTPKSKKKLVIKTNFDTNCVFVENLKSVKAQSVEDAFKYLTYAQSNRIVAGHALNEVSSRSHMLIIFTVIQQSCDGTIKRSKLNFSDLAGSEDLTKALAQTKNTNFERRKEAIAINKSLSALTTAISYLSKGKKASFRDSPLTHILKDSLGGNSRTLMLVTASPHIYNRGETIRTLRFASTAKNVKNKAKINEEESVNVLRKKIKDLQVENDKLRLCLHKSPRRPIIIRRSKTLEIEEDDEGSVIEWDADSNSNSDCVNMHLNEDGVECSEDEEIVSNEYVQLTNEINEKNDKIDQMQMEIKHLNDVISQYQSSRSRSRSQSNDSCADQQTNSDDFDIVLNSEPFNIEQNNLLQDLLSLHQKMEAKITAIRRHTLTNSSDERLESLHNYQQRRRSQLIYESADEKLDEYDLDIISPRVSDEKLKELRQSEDKLQKDLSKKLKEDALSTCSWFSCFFRPSANVIDATSDLIEEYLKTQTCKTMTSKKHKRKIEKERAKAIRIKMGISK